MSNPSQETYFAHHITLTSSKRDPKPTGPTSWWTEHQTHESLGAEARKRFPSSTSGETCNGIVFALAAKKGIL